MKNKEKYRITTPNGIDEKIFVPINGQNQYVFIRGKDVKNPIILNLHGGPANPDGFLTYEFVNEIVDDFTFVSWDQRGCGRTYYENRKVDPRNKTATFEQALKDVDELVNYLCKRFSKEKVIIMGHSYGTLLGVSYVHKYPEKVDKYIGIGQTVSIMDTQTENYNELISLMIKGTKEADKLTKAYNELENNFCIDNLALFQRLTLSYFGRNIPDVVQKNQLKLIFSSPDLSLQDIRWMLGMLNTKKHFDRNKQLLNYTLNSSIYNEGTTFLVPMYFISGEYDKNCNIGILKKYYETITAISKKLIIMEKNGHSPQVHTPKLFAKEVRKLLS